jgi:hypothetical protein
VAFHSPLSNNVVSAFPFICHAGATIEKVSGRLKQFYQSLIGDFF